MFPLHYILTPKSRHFYNFNAQSSFTNVYFKNEILCNINQNRQSQKGMFCSKFQPISKTWNLFNGFKECSGSNVIDIILETANKLLNNIYTLAMYNNCTTSLSNDIKVTKF